MRKDPLIDEIRAVRHRISERFGHDTKKLCDHYRELEERYRDRMLRDRADATAAGSGKPSRGPACG